jgi:chitin-binding protein
MRVRRRLALWLAAAGVGFGAVVVAAAPAQAHGAAMVPGSRTYLCWKDGLQGSNGAMQPKNPACAAAVAQSGPNSLYNWFALLRSDGGGRMSGFIPDGKLCSAAATVYDFAGFDLARNDWPVTHLTAGRQIQVNYSNWAAHPGTFSLYITKDGFNPTTPLKWSDLESTPFDRVTNPPAIGNPGTNDGHYYWNATLPNKSGRHIIYSVWSRSDSQETFYGCSDVVFDGGNGEVTGVGTTGTASPTPSRTYSSTPSPTASRTPSISPTASRSPSNSPSQNPGNGGCTATYSTAGQWGGGFQGEVKVTNSGSSTIGGWKVSWTWPSGQTVSQSWNATLTQSGSTVTAGNVNWNGTIPPGGNATFGFLGAGSVSTPTVSCSVV